MRGANLGAIVVFGLPSSGKGTYSELISKYCSVPRIVISLLLQEATQNDPPLAEKIRSFTSAGKFVPDSIVLSLLEKRVSQRDCSNGFVLDGFPRTLEQAKCLEQMLSVHNQKLSRAIFLDLPVSVAANRLSNRLSCPKCNLTFSETDFPPKKPGFCNNCKSPLVRRKDDKPDVVIARLKSEFAEIKKLKSFFVQKSALQILSARGGRKKVGKNIKALFRTLGERPRFRRMPRHC